MLLQSCYSSIVTSPDCDLHISWEKSQEDPLHTSTLLVCIYLLYIDSVTITLLILLLPLARTVDIICFKKLKEMQLVRV